MSIEKPSNAEDEYFLREEAARKQREALAKAHQIAGEEKNTQKNLHYMKCPKCGFDLQVAKLHGISVDKCYHCGGLWFDKDEWEHIVQRQEPNLFQRIVSVFKHEDQ